MPVKADVIHALDGGGLVLKHYFSGYVRPFDTIYRHVFEWCAGMGSIGLHLLESGLCERLTLADINDEAIIEARKEVYRRGLEDKVELYVSDNMNDIPSGERFDLVVANPPNYFNVQADHPFGAIMYDDLRPNDRGWKIHEAFYAQIGGYLVPGARLLIHEVSPHSQEVFIGYWDIPYDIRDCEPLALFRDMAENGGLEYLGCEYITTLSPVADSYFISFIKPVGA